MKRIGFLGTGHIAAPMVRFLAGKGHDVLVSERNVSVAAELAATCNAQVLANQAVVDGSDIVFLCLRPAIWQPVVADLTFRADQQIISVMANVPYAALEEAVTPAQDISITVPIGFLERGGCPLPVFPKPEPVSTLFAPENPVISFENESNMADHFAASATLSAVLTVMKDGADWLADQTGNEAGADMYFASLLAGFLRDVPKDGKARILEARSGLASPNTLNRAVVDAMETANTRDTIRDVLKSLSARMKGPS
ncbi:MAG: NAD(P)-binding domain-containing protein [Planktotalea sp.]|uniref:NAD(P)-binding domain-containing protein n=1 Tax=Planktotalea sp. TaxID=2029877 RepID=UPI003C73C8E8